MAALLGNPNPGVKPVVYTAIQIQTSSQGIPVPVHYGTVRATDNLIWYGGFRATKVTQGGKGGALGGAAGKNGPVQYKYSASVIFGVCEGPIQGFGQVWATKVATTLSELGLTQFLGTYPQATWGFLTTNYPTQARPYNGLAFLGGSAYQLGASADIPTHTFEVYGFFSNRVVYTTAVIPSAGARTITVGSRLWANGTTQSMWVSNVSIPGYTLVGGAPAAGQYSVSAGVYTFNVANSGATVTIAWNGKGQDADPSLVVADVLSNAYYGVGFPASRVGELNAYSEATVIPGFPYQVSVVHAADYDDNLSVYEPATGTLFTCVAANPGPQEFTYTTGGLYTFNAADIGKTVDIAYVALDGLDTFQNYCWANGFFISCSFIQQQAASGILEEIARYCNSEIVWSSGALKLVPRGDLTLTANGHTYTAPSSTVKDLDDDDYLATGNGTGGASGSPSEDPLLVTRRRVSDQKNVVQLECLDRANQYNAAMVESTDQAAVDLYGRRTTGTLQAHMFADTAVARVVAQLILQREAILNGYSFQLPEKYVWLDPMDIVSVTDAALGLTSASWVRIMSIEEAEDGTLTVQCEEYPDGAANSETYEYGSNDGYAANYNVDPGAVNTPTIFEPSVQLATNTGLEVWCAVSGADENWGGCDVYVSADGTTYNYVGRQWGASRMGLLTAPFASHASPDTVNTLSVDLTMSFGDLVSASVADANLGNTVCLIDSEMISFSAASLTAAYEYDMDTYIVRAQFGTTAAAHLAGASFARLDETIFTFPYDKSQIGQTVYVKFCSFNNYGGGLQDISIATAYPHLIVGPPLPGTVQNFGISQQGGPVVFTWDDLPDFVLKGYDILYGDTSGDITTANFLTDASRATEMTHANVPPGTWTFYIRGHDLADQVGPASSATFTVKNFNFLIADQENDPDWFGTTSNAVRHSSAGLLTLKGTNVSSTYGWEVFDQYVIDPLPLPTYTGVELDSGADGEMRVVLSVNAVAASAYGETGVPAHTGQIRYKTSAGAYGPYEDWVSGTVTARYVQAQFIMDTTVQNYVSVIDLLLDSPPVTQVISQEIIDVAGTTVFFPTAFRNEPNVQVTPAAAGATSGSAESITTTSALIKLWNGAVQVAGTANIAATGV